MDEASTVHFQRKQALYRGLDAVDEDDEAADPGMEAAKAALQPRSKKYLAFERHENAKAKTAGPRSRLEQEKSNSPLPRSASDPNLEAKAHAARASRDTDVQLAVNPTPELPRSLQRGATFSGAIPSASAVPRATGKRKRDNDLRVTPEGQQIFKGLHFYFFPNNDAHPARRMRITKALEFGATWKKDVADSVTHVIVDKAMSYEMLLKFLKIEVLPTHLMLANETYPSECMAYRTLLDPKQPQFQIRGAPSLAAPQAKDQTAHDMRPLSADSDTSLKLKPAGKAVMAREPDTPRAEEAASSQRATSPS